MLKSLKTSTRIIPALAATVLLTAGAAQAADRSLAPAAADPVQIAASSGSAETSFEDKKAEAEKTFESWGNQIAEQAEKADAKAQDMADEAGDALNAAWADVQATWEDVKDASEENWDEAKAKFDESIERLEAAWNELQGG